METRTPSPSKSSVIGPTNRVGTTRCIVNFIRLLHRFVLQADRHGVHVSVLGVASPSCPPRISSTLHPALRVGGQSHDSLERCSPDTYHRAASRRPTWSSGSKGIALPVC